MDEMDGSAKAVPGVSVAVPRAGRRYRMTTVAWDRKKKGFDEGTMGERTVEIVSVDCIASACVGDELRFTGRDCATGERMRGSMIVGGGTDGIGFHAEYGTRTVAGMSIVPNPEKDGRDGGGNGAAAAPRPEIGPGDLPDVFPMAGGRRYDLEAVFPDGRRRLLRGASRRVPDRRCASMEGSVYRMEFRVDLSPEDADLFGSAGGCLYACVEMSGPDGMDIRMDLSKNVLDGPCLDVARITPADEDAARDAAGLLDEHLETYARFRRLMLDLNGGAHPA